VGDVVRAPCAGSLLAIATLVLSVTTLAAPQDALLQSEALKADQRMLDNVRAFAKALHGVLGREPSLAALEVSENTGSALVRLEDGSTRSFAFVEGKLSEPDPSPLRDESPPAEALAGRFTFASIDFNRVRAALKAQRAKPGHGGDTAPELAIRYRSIVGRWMLTVQLGSMASAGLELISYDFRSGEVVDLKGIVAKRNAEVEAHNQRVRAQQKAFDDEQQRLAQINMLGLGAEALNALAREVGTTPYLRNVVVEVEQIRLTTLDPRAGGEVVTYRYNRSKKLVRMDTREAQITRCEDPFTAGEFDWMLLPALVEQAFVALGTDRSADVRVDVERPHGCGPLHAQVSLEKNHNINGAYFDRGGHLYRVD